MQNKRSENVSMNDRAQIISRLEFGAALEPSLVQRLAASATVREFRRRRTIYRAGDEANGNRRRAICSSEP